MRSVPTVRQGQMREHAVAEPGYRYYAGKDATGYDRTRSIEAALELSRDRWNPRRNDPDYLILWQRRRIFSDWLHRIEGNSLQVLDVGGRLQPYRLPLEGRVRHYVAVDPQLEGLADVVAIGEELPFA